MKSDYKYWRGTMNKKLSVFLIVIFFVIHSPLTGYAIDKTPEQIVKEAKAAINEVSY
jgi:hypothetical protein